MRLDARSGTLAAAILASAMGFIDGSAVNVALPVMQRDLHASAAQIQWIVEGYLLFLSALILIGGALGDRFGRRAMFQGGTALFTIASLACAAAGSPVLLIAARCLQGAGGALMIPGSLALITAAYPHAERGRAIGTWSAASAMTTALAPLLGGWLTQAVTWRAVFLINAPLAAVVLVLSFAGIRESKAEQEHCSPDVAGSACITLALGSLVFGMMELQRAGTDRGAVAALAASISLFALFSAIERRARVPIVPPELFVSRTFTLDNAYTLLMYAALGGGLFLVPFDLIVVRAYTPAAAGMALLPFVIPLSLFSRFSGALADRIGPRTLMSAGAFVAGAGFALFAMLRADWYWSGVFPAALLTGIGATLFVAPLTASVMSAAPQEFAGAASGVNNAVSRAAGMLAIAGLGILARPLLAHAPGASAGFSQAMLAAAALAICASFVAAFVPGIIVTDER